MNSDSPLPALQDELVRHAQFVRRLARSLVADAATADDVAQEAHLAALRHRPNPDGGLRGWLSTTVRRCALRTGRDEGRRQRREERAARSDVAHPGWDRETALREILEAVLALDPPLRQTVLHRYYEDLSPAEIAQRTGVPPATVRTRLHRALQKLRARLTDKGGPRFAAPLTLWFAKPLIPSAAASATAGSVIPASLGVLVMTKKLALLAVLAVAVGWATLWEAGPERESPPTDSRGEASAPPILGPTPTVDRDPAPIGAVETARFSETARPLDVPTPGAGLAVATLTGRVTDPSGEPQGNVPVRLWLERVGRPATPGYSRSEALSERDTQTDDAGRFSFANIPIGYEARLRARPESLCDAHHTLLIDSAGERSAGDLIVGPGGGVSGRVVLPTGLAPSAVRVQASRHEATGSAPGVLMFRTERRPTDPRERTPQSDGSFFIPGLSAGRWRLRLVAPGYPDTEGPLVDVRLGATADRLVITLETGRALSGTVTDGRGLPIRNANVRFQGPAVPTLGMKAIGMVETTTDSQGHFQFGGLSQDPGRLTIDADGFAVLTRNDVTPADGQEYQLDPAGRIAGTVVDTHGEPVADAVVLPAVTSEGWSLIDLDSPGRMKVVTGEAAAAALGVPMSPGLFAVTNVPDRPVQLTVSKTGYGRKTEGPVQIALGTTHDWAVVLEPEAKVTGRVVDGQGQPVGGATVSVSSPEVSLTSPGGFARREVRVVGAPSDPALAVRSADDGTFVVGGIGPGQYEFAASHSDHSSQSPVLVEVPKAGAHVEDVVLRLATAGRVFGRALDEDGRPLRGVSVTLQERISDHAPGRVNRVAGPIRVVTNAQGEFEAGGLRPGGWEARLASPRETAADAAFVTVNRGSSAPRSDVVPFEIRENDTTEITLRKPTTGTVAGVILEGGQPVPSVDVVLDTPDSSASMPVIPGMGPRTATANDGTFHFTEVLPGNYQLRIRPPGGLVPILRDVIVLEGQPEWNGVIELPTASISGRVVDHHGEPVAGLTIKVRPASARHEREPSRVMVAVMDTGNGPDTSVQILGPPGGGAPVLTDQRGHYRVPYLEGGTYDVSVAGGGWIERTAQDVEVWPGQSREHVDLATAKGATLIVTGESSDGDPSFLVGTVRRPKAEDPASTQATVGGKPLKFEGLESGIWEIRLDGDGLHGEQSVPLNPGEERTVTIPIRKKP